VNIGTLLVAFGGSPERGRGEMKRWWAGGGLLEFVRWFEMEVAVWRRFGGDEGVFRWGFRGSEEKKWWCSFRG